ncbi:cytochrome P450 86B1 [Malania oleifera]|uniref:cytochrome P450 86B1 n=1 Tax=Malania oleifera TaxID=397392 RepID=UPI0025ADE39E|nr:cytochrome P450 86B1 [Malania oleifera]
MIITVKRAIAAVGWVPSHVWASDIAVALLGLFLFSSLLQRLTHKGPMLWPVMGMAPAFFLHLHHIYDWVTQALIQSGGKFNYRGIWMGGAYGLITADPSHIEYLLKTNFSNFPKGKYYRERFRDLLGDGIFNADDHLWKHQRRAATSEMHSRHFAHYSLRTITDLVHHKLLKLTNKLASSGERVDLQEVLLRFTFDNICTAAFGVDPGCLALDLPEVPFARAFEEATECTLFRFLVPPFVWKPMRFFLVGSENRLAQVIRTVHDFAEKTVRDRREELRKVGSLNGRSDLLSRVMENEQYNFSDNLLKDFCISFILAGRDTSSVGLAWFFWLIHENPRVQTRILREIGEILSQRKTCGAEEANKEEDVVFAVEELEKMVYLEAALSEAMRLYPPVPMDFKEVLEDDVFPDGTAVRRGARVMYSIFSMGRMERIWGKDCEEYKPERWINKEGQVVRENQFKYPVFNAGPRMCVGKKFAYVQMKMVAAAVMLRYAVEVVDGWSVVPKITTTLYMKHGLQVTFKPRSSTLPGLSSAS